MLAVLFCELIAAKSINLFKTTSSQTIDKNIVCIVGILQFMTFKTH